MKAVVYDECGGPEVLTLRRVDAPKVKDDEVLIKVAATTVSRIDLWRRSGRYGRNKKYPLGLECSGKIVGTGRLVTGWKKDDEVCALLGGGGYAHLVAVSAKNIISAPKNLALASAAALPCAACLFCQCFILMNKLTRGQKVLIHGGAGGVGSLAIQIAKHYGCRVFATAGSKERVQFCASLGADVCINHKEEDIYERLKVETKGTGVDYVLDCFGSRFCAENINSLADGGRLIVIGYEEDCGSFDLSFEVLAWKGLEVMGADIIKLSPSDKERLLRLVKKEIWPLIENGLITPVICRTSSFQQAVDAHKLMEKNGHLGKILLTPT